MFSIPRHTPASIANPDVPPSHLKEPLGFIRKSQVQRLELEWRNYYSGIDKGWCDWATKGSEGLFGTTGKLKCDFNFTHFQPTVYHALDCSNCPHFFNAKILQHLKQRRRARACRGGGREEKKKKRGLLFLAPCLPSPWSSLLRSYPDLSRSSVHGLQLQWINRGLWTG